MAVIPDPRKMQDIVNRLIKAEDEVLRLKAEYESLFSQPDTEDERTRTSIGERIAELLNGRYTETFTASQVAQILDAKITSVGPNLSRLVGEGKIRKVGHGEYRSNHYKQLIWKTLGSAEELAKEESPVAPAG